MYYLCKTAKCHVLAYYATDEWQSTCFSCPRRRIRHGSVSKLFPGYRVCSSILQHVEMHLSNVILLVAPPPVQTLSVSFSKRYVTSMKLNWNGSPSHSRQHLDFSLYIHWGRNTSPFRLDLVLLTCARLDLIPETFSLTIPQFRVPTALFFSYLISLYFFCVG